MILSATINITPSHTGSNGTIPQRHLPKERQMSHNYHFAYHQTQQYGFLNRITLFSTNAVPDSSP
jgi:hypothetical protein